MPEVFASSKKSMGWWWYFNKTAQKLPDVTVLWLDNRMALLLCMKCPVVRKMGEHSSSIRTGVFEREGQDFGWLMWV